MSHALIRKLTNAVLLSSLGVALTTQVASAQNWTDNVEVGAFVDAYAAYRSDKNSAGVPVSEAYVENNGFNLAFAGADLSYAGKQFGATISLRYGPGVVRFYGADMGGMGLDNITQGFVTWKPMNGLTLDLGQFNTIYGAEVTESWRNVNYSRGALYYTFQPFWHTGLRANYAFNDKFGVTAMVVNGVNSAVEANKSPSVGLQVTLAPTKSFFLALGYLGALHPRDGDEANGPTGKFDNFFDLVLTYATGDFKLVANADYNMYRQKGAEDGESNWGVSVAPAYSINNWFGIGARGEYLKDSADAWFGMPNATEDTSLMTFTGTLDFKPVPGSSALVLRPEFRYEMASEDYFTDRDSKGTDAFWVATLGAVVTSM